MADRMTPEEIQAIFDEYNDCIKRQIPISAELAKDMKDANVGIRNYTNQLNASLKQLGTSGKQLAEDMLAGKQGAAVFNGAVSSAGDAASKAAMQFGPLGVAIGAVIKVLTFFVTAVNEQADALYDTNKELAKNGLATAGGMTEIFGNMQKFSYGVAELGDMTRLLANHSQALAMLGGTAGEGAKTLANMSKGIKDSGLRNQFMDMGMSVDMINTGLANYVRSQVQAGKAQGKTTAELTAGAAHYIMNLDKLSKLTGASADQLAKAQDEANAIDAFRATLDTLDPKVAEQKMNTYLLLKQRGLDTQALGYANTVSGYVGLTDEAAQLFMATGGKSVKIATDNTLKAAEALDALGTATTATLPTQRAIARMGDGGKTYGSYYKNVQMAALGLGKAIEMDKKATLSQKEQIENTDPLLKSQNELRQSQMDIRDSFQQLINKGIGPTTKVFAKLTETVNKLLNLFGLGVSDEDLKGKDEEAGGGTISGDKKAILDLIGQHESHGNYNVLVGGKQADLQNMTIAQVMQLQKGMTKQAGFASSAVGKYQFIASTLANQVRELGLDINTTKFDAKTQDLLASHLLDSRGWGKKDEKAMMLGIAQEWASMPKDMGGLSYYQGVNGNRSSATPEQVLAALRNKGSSTTPTAPTSKSSSTTPAATTAPTSKSVIGTGITPVLPGGNLVGAYKAYKALTAPSDGRKSTDVTTAQQNMPTAPVKTEPQAPAGSFQADMEKRKRDEQNDLIVRHLSSIAKNTQTSAQYAKNN